MTENLMEQLATEQNPLEAMIVTKDNTPKACLANCNLMLRHDPVWQGVLVFNEFSQHVETAKPTPWAKPAGSKWSDADDSLCTEWLQHEGIGVQTHIVAEAIRTVARERPIHPVRDYFTGLKFDGKPRIGNWLITYLGAADTPFVRAIGARWLISGVARILIPGCQADHVLLLQGQQGIGKSSALRELASDEYFTDHVSDLGSKDSRIELCGKWIVEHAELDSIRRGQLERVKAFLTARFDHFRLPYARSAASVPRSCIFAATTNDATPLNDETGARRFWPARCMAVDVPALKRDRNQLWAEAYERFKAGEVWWLDSAELNAAAEQEQEKRYEGDAWDGSILTWCDTPHRRSDASEVCTSEIGRITVTDVLVHAIGKPLDRITQADQNRVARCLKHAGWERKQVRSGSNRGKWFYVRADEGEE